MSTLCSVQSICNAFLFRPSCTHQDDTSCRWIRRYISICGCGSHFVIREIIPSWAAHSILVLLQYPICKMELWVALE